MEAADANSSRNRLELMDQYLQAPTHEDRVLVLLKASAELSVFDADQRKQDAALVAASLLQSEDQIRLFASYFGKRTETPDVILAPGIQAEYAADFEALGYSVAEILCLIGDCCSWQQAFVGS